jgi:hypothetical protein
MKLFNPRRQLVILTAFLAAFIPLTLITLTTNRTELTQHPGQIDVPIESAFRGNPVGLFWVVLLVGFATASFVQWAKDFLRWRYNFHRRMVRDWIDHRFRQVSDSIVAALRDEKSPRSTKDPRLQLEILAGGEKVPEKAYYLDPYIFPAYSLPVEQLCGQLAAAAEIAVANPEKFPELFCVLTAAGDLISDQDFREYLAKPTPPNQDTDQAAKSVPEGELSPTAQRYAELRAQFMMQAQRGLDNLQIAIGEGWRAQLTRACLLFSLAFAVVVVSFLLASDPARNAMGFIQAWFTVVVITLAGVLLAPVTHDLMRAIRSFRR